MGEGGRERGREGGREGERGGGREGGREGGRWGKGGDCMAQTDRKYAHVYNVHVHVE